MKKFLLLAALMIGHFAMAQQPAIKAYYIDLNNYAYPYPVQTITLRIQGNAYKMAYMDVKPSSANGHIVMLLHGKNFNGAYWRQTAKVLVENGYRVIIPDQLSFGKSSKPQHLQYSFQLLAANTKALLDSLRVKKLSVLGHSMGGMVATRFTLMYPGLVEKLILENPIGLEDWKLKVPYQTVDDWYRNEIKQNYTSLKAYQQQNYYHGTWKPEYDEWLQVPAGWTMNKAYNKIAWNSALTYDMIFTQPVCYEFDSIHTSTLLMIGQEDKTALGKNLVPDAVKEVLGNYPALGKITQQKVKNAKLVELKGVGHIPHIESFDAFVQPLLQFLKE